MPETWFFTMDGDVVDMVCRAEGAGAVGDARSRLRPDGPPIVHPKGLTYEALAAAGGGTLEINDDETFKIVPSGGK